MAARSLAQLRGRFESLEQRHLLAGDVLVNVVGGNLRIEGDVEANKILITAGAEAGTFVVTGLDGTTLGGETDPVTVTDVRNIHVAMGDGDDLVAVAGASVRGHVAIRTGEGNDRVAVGTDGGAAELAGVLPEDLAVEVRGSLSIATGAGADQVSVDSTTAALVKVSAGDDNDVVNLGSDESLGDLTARLTARLGAHVDLGDGNDELTLDQVETRGLLAARGGLGDDSVDASLTTAGAMLVSTDGGVDSINLADLDVRHLGLHTGDGNDTVEVSDSVFTTLGVVLGDGDDTLTTSALEARVAILAGGDGSDTLDEVTASVFAHQRILGFEIPPDINTNQLPSLRRLIGRLLGRL
jgi:hypothetical protein